MKTKFIYIGIFILTTLIFSCNEEKVGKLPPVEQRVSEAISSLRSDLLAPTNGWRLQYQPTNESGIFFMLLEFDENDEVRIKSDQADNDGEFFDHTIPWRIDNAMGLELIFETYGVFHYMFELDGATFGAEFEWLFVSKDGDKLIFKSISDFANDQTNIILEPASPNDENLFARDIAQNLNAFTTIGPKALEVPRSRQQVIMQDANISVYWSLDPTKRIVESSLATTGADFEDPNFTAVVLNHRSGYQLQNGAMVLLEPLEFVLNNRLYSIGSVAFSEFSNTGPSLCSFGVDDGPEYTGQISGLGSVSMIASLFDLEGTAFQPIAEFPYSVNSFFIFDETGTSLSEEGKILAEKFPNAVGFLFYYGFDSDTQPSNAVGFILDDGNGNSDLFVREFLPTTTVGNKIPISLTNNYYHSGTPGLDDEANLAEITDLLFEGGDVFASDFPVEGLTVFKLFNPCNQYEMFLVQ
jgi:hypothetical protein